MSPRKHVNEIEVPGTPDQVWDAIATGPGISAWFVPTEVDGRPGGEVVTHHGPGPGMESRGRITAYEPPHRFAYVERWDDVDFATEFLVQARGGGTCVVRIVSSGFGDTEEWDRQIENMDRGWRSFLDNLRLYLATWPGARGAQVIADALRPGDAPAAAWAALREGLGVPDAPGVGATVASAPGAPRFTGIVERSDAHEIAVRVSEPGDGLLVASAFPWEDDAMVRLHLYLYGDDAGAQASALTPGWREWLTERLGTARTPELSARPGRSSSETDR